MVFTPLEKGLLVPGVFLSGLIVSLVFYKLAKRPLKGSQTYLMRDQYLYSAVAGGLLGQFFMHTWPNTSVYPFSLPGSTAYARASAALLIAYYLLMWVHKFTRIFTGNPHYTEPEANNVEIHDVINHTTHEEGSYVEFEDPSSEEAARQGWSIDDQKAELRRRRRLSVCLFVVMITVQVLEGFMLSWRLSSSGLLVGMFVLNKVIESVIMMGFFVYVFYYTERRAFFILSLVWILATTLSTLPALLDMTSVQAQGILQHPACSIFYAVAGSVILWIYGFMRVEPPQAERKTIFFRLLVFGLFMSLSWVTGYFL